MPGRKLGRKTDHRLSMLRGQVTFLLLQYWPELLLGFVFSLPLLPRMKTWVEEKGGAASRATGIAAPAVLLVLAGLSYISLLSSGFNPFIYFQF